MFDERKFWFLQRKKSESSRKKMKSVSKVSSDGIVHEARVLERFNINLRSASDFKSQSHD